MNFLGFGRTPTSSSRPSLPATSTPSSSMLGISKQQQLRRYAEATLGSASLQQAVLLPPGENTDEWIAAYLEDFYTHINLLYATITEHCTPQSCPVMSAGPKYEYYWSDPDQYPKPTRLSAPEYVDELMRWVQKQFDDEHVFPTKIGVAFPKTFRASAKAISRRLFRVYAHLYLHHFEQMRKVGMEMHLNTSFKHFVYFIMEFELVDRKEMQPVAELVQLLTGEKV